MENKDFKFSKARFFIIFFLILIGIGMCVELSLIFYKTNFLANYQPSFCVISDLIDCDTELQRLEDADYELCTALFTMLLREDHFCNGSLCKRYESGQLDVVLRKMIKELEA